MIYIELAVLFAGVLAILTIIDWHYRRKVEALELKVSILARKVNHDNRTVSERICKAEEQIEKLTRHVVAIDSAEHRTEDVLQQIRRAFDESGSVNKS